MTEADDGRLTGVDNSLSVPAKGVARGRMHGMYTALPTVGQLIWRWIELQGRDGRLRAQLFELGVVSEERIAENGNWVLHVDVPRETAERLGRLPGKDGEIVREQLLA